MVKAAQRVIKTNSDFESQTIEILNTPIKFDIERLFFPETHFQNGTEKSKR